MGLRALKTLAIPFLLVIFANGFLYSQASFARTGEAPASGVSQISETEFRQLAQDLAGRVNLFRDVWRQDPSAEFYGGTSRDFLYWVRGQFREATSRADAVRIMERLRALPSIDVREFIMGDSDVDIITSRPLDIQARTYGVRVIDQKDNEIFNSLSEAGISERRQGHIPAEKIRLSRSGFPLSEGLGDGVAEIYSGRLTIQLPSAADFALTKYAATHENHPILLVLRYLRLQAAHHFYTSGRGATNPREILERIDPAIDRSLREVIRTALNGRELRKHFEQPRFARWFNATLAKAFRSYTNPNAALDLVRHYQIDQLPRIYPQIEPFSQVLFARAPDLERATQSVREFRVNEQSFLRNVNEVFPGGVAYHGSGSDQAFRNILFQGILPSAGGSAGDGLYVVNEQSRAFAETFNGTTRDRLVRIPIEPSARVVDITQGEGARVWRAFVAKHGENHSLFAEMFDIDILRYPYGDTIAYVVKNSRSLGRPQGVYRQLLLLPELMERARTVSSPGELFEMISLNSLTSDEQILVWQNSPHTRESLREALSSPTYLRELFSRVEPDSLRVYIENVIFELQDRAASHVDIFLEQLDRLHAVPGELALRVLELANPPLSPENARRALSVIGKITDQGFRGKESILSQLARTERLYQLFQGEAAVDMMDYLLRNGLHRHAWVERELKFDRFRIGGSESSARRVLEIIGRTKLANLEQRRGSDRDVYAVRDMVRMLLREAPELTLNNLRAELERDPLNLSRQATALVEGNVTDRSIQALIGGRLNRSFRFGNQRLLEALSESRMDLLKEDTAPELVEALLRIARRGNRQERTLAIKVLGHVRGNRELLRPFLAELDVRSMPRGRLTQLSHELMEEERREFSARLSTLSRWAEQNWEEADALMRRQIFDGAMADRLLTRLPYSRESLPDSWIEVLVQAQNSSSKSLRNQVEMFLNNSLRRDREEIEARMRAMTERLQAEGRLEAPLNRTEAPCFRFFQKLGRRLHPNFF